MPHTDARRGFRSYFRDGLQTSATLRRRQCGEIARVPIFANRRTTASSPHFRTTATSRTVSSSDMRCISLPSSYNQRVEAVLSGLCPRGVVLLGRLDAGVSEQFANLFHRDARRQPIASGGVPQTMRGEVRFLSESRTEQRTQIVLPVRDCRCFSPPPVQNR